ncbi:peptidoglycan-associated lipoprotein [Cellvibrio zantedeschiae]|uniref:Peptidoglycan-associated lipoprotein n=1 Tax=Cellvibrio zantedeschiae TaxID=1237077 RepID=A0ABQ3AVN4_9GAMM|nr:peptidoglycan-associated lipoprotein Pal [Cellvibrio zantedeschiae]GGY65964.1 peptidoglycan-associated lipoprotein [Cellvibrio zantedeschiae]
MITKAIKQGLTLAVVMAFLVGCSSSDKKKTTAPAATPAPVATETAAPVKAVANVVYFEFNKYDLSPEARAILLAHAEKLKGSSAAVRLEGHASEEGSREYNMALGEKRAKAARDFLVLQGVKAASLEVVSYGEERPVATGHDEASYTQNRRVEIK